MINVSQAFKDKIAIAGKVKDTKISYDGVVARPQHLKIGYDGQLFKTIMKYAEFEIKDNENLADKEVNIKHGLFINNAFEYIDFKTFKVKECEDIKEKNTIKALSFDNMIKFMKPFNLQLNYPLPLGDYVEAICNVCGVELYTKEFFNSDLSIDEDYFTVLNASYRDVLGQVAQTICSTFFIKSDKLYPGRINDTGEVLNPDVLKKFKLKEKFGPCNSLVLAREPQEGDDIFHKDNDSIAEHGLHELKFVNNEIINKRRESVVDAMYEEVAGIEYYSYESKDLGLGYLEPLDLIGARDLQGNIYKVLVLNMSLTCDSGQEGTSASDIPSTSTTNYQYATDSQKRQLRTEILVNKQQGQINLVVDEQSSQGNRLTEIKSTVDNVNINVSNSVGSNLLQNATLKFGLDKHVTINGTVTFEDSLDIIKNTISKTSYKINNGYVKYDRVFCEVGTYTLSLKVLKKANTIPYININSGVSQVLEFNVKEDNLEEIILNIENTVGYIDVEIGCNENYCLISDVMLNSGANKLTFSLYPGEIISTNYKFSNDTGLEITSTIEKTKLSAGASEIAIYNIDNNEKQVSFNKDNTELTRATVKYRFNEGKLRHAVLDNGDVMLTFDD